MTLVVTIVVLTSISATIVSASIVLSDNRLRKKAAQDEHRDHQPADSGRDLRGRPGPLRRSTSPSPTTASPPSAAASTTYDATLDRRRGAEARGHASTSPASTSTRSSSRATSLSPDFFDAERYPQLKFSSTELERRRRRHASGSRRARDPRRDPRGRGRAAASARSAPTSAATPRVGLSLETAVDRRDFGLDWNADLPSGGEVLEYEVDDQRRARVRRGGRVTMRVLGISGSLRRDSLQQRPAAGGRRAAARRGGAGRVRAPARRSRPTTRTSKCEAHAGGGARSCARRSARPTRS